jgi:hypothetical protein
VPLVQVEGADGHAVRRHLFEYLAVCLVLHVLCRRIQRALGQQELRAVQSNAVGARLVEELQITQQLEVGIQPDWDAVGGGQRPPCAACRRSGPRPARRGAFGSLQFSCVWPDAHFTRGAVENQGDPRCDSPREVVQADDSWHLQ